MDYEESNQTIESALVSACFLDSGTLDTMLSSGLPLEAFEDQSCKEILAVVLAQYQNGLEYDSSTVLEEIMGNRECGITPVQLMEITTAVESTAWVKSHIQVLNERHNLKKLRSNAQKILEVTQSEPWRECKDKVSGIIGEMSSETVSRTALGQKAVGNVAIEEVKRVIEGKPIIGSKPIRTGIACIDNYCRPLDVATGDFNCILFAATSTGKSSLMAQIVSHNIRKGLKVAAFLGETSHEGIFKQMGGQIVKCSTDSYDLKQEPTDRQINLVDVLERLNEFHDKNLWVYDDDFYIEDIVARCRKLDRDNAGLDLVVIDHLHCLKSRKRFSDERLRYNYMSAELKPLGMRLNCPILCLAQPSRGFKSGDREPLLSDLKESGNLEDDADRVWALHLPSKDTEGGEQTRHDEVPQIHLHQLKFRRGRTCKVKLRLEKRYTLFTDDQTEEL